MLHATREAILNSNPTTTTSDCNPEAEEDIDEPSEEDDVMDFEGLMHIERKSFKQLEQTKKKRAKLTQSAAADKQKSLDNFDVLCKEFPFDKQISYNLLSDLLQEDEAVADESRYQGNCLAVWKKSGRRDNDDAGVVWTFFPDQTQSRLLCYQIEANRDDEKDFSTQEVELVIADCGSTEEQNLS